MYKDYNDFFEKCGDQWLHPTQFGECIYPMTVEEMYQHFKSRIIAELAVKSEEMLYSAELFDTQNTQKKE